MSALHVKLRSLRGAIAMAAFAATLLAPSLVRAQVVVVANGSPITELDIQQREKLIASSTHKHPSRKDVINELINDRLKIAKAKSYGLVVTDKQVDAAFDNMAKRQGVTPEQFTQFLKHAGVTTYAVKQRIRAEMTWGELIRGKFDASLHVSDADIAQAVRRQSGGSASEVGYIYTLYPVTVVAASGTSASVMAAKRREAENLRSRFTNCRQGLALARTIPDVAVRQPMTKSSADLPKALRELLGKMEIGHLTAPDVTAQGLQMFAVCGKKETKVYSPLRAKVKEEIYAKRFKAASESFLADIRRSAMIEYKR
jgi:peptidyl-prolyl cis-trans isomerase SurA